MNNDIKKCIENLEEFTQKYLSGDLDKIKYFNFFELWEKRDSKFGGPDITGKVKSGIDPDNSNIMNDIYYIIWNNILPELKSRQCIGTGIGKTYRGDTINTYGWLFCLDSLYSEHYDLIVPEIKEEVLVFQERYLTIGNFYLLPSNSTQKGTINQYRGSKWRDYFPVFLEALEKTYNPTETDKKDVAVQDLIELKNANDFYFSKMSFDDFIKINYLPDYKDAPEILKKRYCFRYDRRKSDYVQFALEYINYAEKMIFSRADKMIAALKDATKI